ncbi:phage terminase small subunit P27 family [Hahella sp. CR1]|uniref:phage terminase small subunit P27 family n=1 Tax=Hahella sp. CR1 TaxID=2992807 RepID=UPI0024417A3B|nr:phage terminase small subunit P27 family [Hahella sp. CR1]MDG9671826.1 phage terminase small subunit P27 family [Hahella sp. CR1]
MSGTATRAGRGRKPKPVAQKLLAGNPGKRQLNTHEPQFSQITNIDCPDWLGDDARRMWELIAPELCAQKIIAITDAHNLEAFCAAYGRWRQAERELAQYGITTTDANGGLKKNPAATVANESLKQLATFGALLGLDPSSRQRLTGGGNHDTSNPFDKF